MSASLKMVAWILLLAVSCTSIGCSGSPTIDPEKDKPVMDNVPPAKP